MATSNHANASKRARRESLESEATTKDGSTNSMTSPPVECYQIIDIYQWLSGCYGNSDGNEGDDAKNASTLPLVDLRSYDDFDKRHIVIPPEHTKNKGSAEKHGDVPIVNLPLSTLLSGERSCELPPRDVEFAILIPRQFTQTFLLHKKEDCSIHQLFFASQSKSTLQSRKPWLVRQVLIDGDKLWKDASEIGLVQCCEKGSCSGESTFPFRSLARLWKPDPLISSYLLSLLKEWIVEEHTDEKKHAMAINNDLPNTSIKSGINPDDTFVGVVLDLGSGAGRDICYLAEELKEFQHSLLQHYQQNQCRRSIHFVGMDNHKGSAKRCLPLWKNRKVDDITHSFLLDLNKLHSVRDHFMDISKLQLQPAEQSAILCIFAIRFLNRRLLSYIANSRSTNEPGAPSPLTATTITKKSVHLPPPPLVLPVGTYMAISHFCKPDEGASWNFDHPKESNVLERRELKQMFGGTVCENPNGDNVQRWQILKDDIIFDGDHGRTLIQFVAKKVA
ncbi:hypothetical protein ACHAXR_012651 [Thalassiosira sp. AJA248-18]